MIVTFSPTKIDGVESFPTIETIEISGENLSQIDFLKIELLIFTSARAIEIFNKIYNFKYKKWQEINSIAIGQKSSDKILELGGKLLFKSDFSHGDKFAFEILKRLKINHNFWLYLRPEKTENNISGILKNGGANLIELPIYKTVCKLHLKYIDFDEDTIFIVSAPSTFNCFIKYLKINKIIHKNSWKFIAIGETTFRVIPEDYKKYISSEQTLESCFQLALSLKLKS